MVMDMKKLMKQMQQVQVVVGKIQDELVVQLVEGIVSGLVMVQMNGYGKVISLKIKFEVVDGDDVEVLEDLILVVINDVVEKVEGLQCEVMVGLGLFGF